MRTRRLRANVECFLMAGVRGCCYVVVLAFMACGQLMQANIIYSGTLEVSFHDCVLTQGGVGPLSASCASSNGGGQGVADYTSMGVTGSTSGSAWSSRTDVFDTLTVGGVPAGTAVNLTFLTTYSGSYSFISGGTNGGVEVVTTVLLGIGDPLSTYIINDSLDFRLCDPSWIASMSCLDYGPTLSGTVSKSLVSSTLGATAGVGSPNLAGIFVTGE